MALKRANIFVSGNVQMAGFRTFVKNFADSLDIKGYAENLPDGRVRIVCEGEEENILSLENSLKETPPPFVRVDHTEIKFAPYSGEFSSFDRKGLDVIEENENTTTLLKSMVNYMKIFVDKSEVVNTRLGEIKVSVDDMHVTLKSVKEDTSAMLEKQDMMLEKQDMMLEKQDMMLEKQDITIDVLKSVKEDTARIRQDTARIPDIVKNTETILEHTSHIPAMKEDTAAIRYDTKEIATKLWEKYEELSKEIVQMKITLSKIEAKVFS